jgi:hypothetical protein
LFFFAFPEISLKNTWILKKYTTFAVPTKNGVVAQLVEQRTENPCVTGSIPVDTTQREFKTLYVNDIQRLFFALHPLLHPNPGNLTLKLNIFLRHRF